MRLTGKSRPPKGRLWIGGILIILIGLVVTTKLSARSLPGGTLYGLKLATEEAWPHTRLRPKSKALIHLKIANRKFRELEDSIRLDRPEAVTVAAGQLSQQIMAAENEIRVEKIRRHNISQLKEALCEQLEAYQPQMTGLIANTPERAKADVLSTSDLITNGIAQAESW